MHAVHVITHKEFLIQPKLCNSAFLLNSSQTNFKYHTLFDLYSVKITISYNGLLNPTPRHFVGFIYML